MINEKKVKLGQFFTKSALWLKPQILEFINNSNCSIAYDPFAGAGDILNVLTAQFKFNEYVGLDIDAHLNWKLNDSLLNIPLVDHAIIVTNPPYIAKQSASKKKIDLSLYFGSSPYEDIYLIALEKMLENHKFVVAIVPESFINSNFKHKNLLSSITILEENPFNDTEIPVCVVCFDSVNKPLSQVKIYKNNKLINNFQSIIDVKLLPKHNVKIKFNTLDGWLGLRAADSSNDVNFIKFDFKENFSYNWQKNIKISSRHYSLIDVDIPKDLRSKFIDICNQKIQELRWKSSDIIFSPFKGNTKNGIRRRRLDFNLARAIMEKAYFKIYKDKTHE
ncbi:Eco57I restriction-modification methylase domain-containing protein [Mycoplasmopsis primatum]|uniref:Eco57I restriction-modification methylase domain-containing protein n=1 Tax=Mycoplasmopsis primatum TaxID=55604 RepID=UPI000497145C|nr:hypothetical protein [Mycoplasmopsis primatum]